MAPPEINEEIAMDTISNQSSSPFGANTKGNYDDQGPMGLYREKKGMYVTARNLTMTVGTEKDNNQRNILSDLNFFLKPGSMVLILGSPGCGKTSVFKALSQQTHDERISGSLLFNGKLAHEDTHHRDVSYVVQDDHHMAPFTVRETFKFSADLQMPEGSSEEEKNARVDYILKTLDLERQQDTVVGNEFLRGVSGGQKKRVTIGVELVKDAGLVLMDEPTTGLDSTTSLDLMKHFRELSNRNNVATMVALLQPGVELTKLFDFLMVLNQGHMVYFGPMSDAIGYFESLGFKLPLHHNPAEFFQEIVDEPELYWGGEGEPTFRGAEDFAEAYKNSEMFQSIINDLDGQQPDYSQCKDSSHLAKYPTELNYQVHLASIRAFKMLISNPVAVRMRIMKSIVMGLILGSLFWNLAPNQTDGQNRSGLIFFALLFILFSGMGAIAILFEQREVFYVQKDGKYYRTMAFFLSLIFAEIPIAALETVVFTVLVYWMCGLQANAEKFIYFLLMNFVGDLAFQSFFKMVSAFSPNQTIASVIAPAALSPFILFAGFMAPRKSIGGWWIWIYWISPIKYAFEGLMSNEHHGLKYHCESSELQPPFPEFFGGNVTQICPIENGDQFLDQLGMPQNNWFKWIDLVIVFAFGVIFSILMYFFLKNIHYDHRASDPKNDKKLKKKSVKKNKIKESKVEIVEKKAKSQKEVPIGCYMQWKDLIYEVDIKKDGKKQRLRLLNEINGYVKPGMLLALMGPSGAGKSTLLDVLANRKTGGHTKGEILINGQKRDKYFTRLNGYVEQLDVLPPTQTVREAITFSAKLRLPADMPMDEKIKFVENILETLNLIKIQNKPIGHGEEGLSLSQRKRVNIGIELASDPQLLFLDEPTSGLDSSSALKVMNLIKKIAESGRSIICTIHQPSTSIFKKFDHLLLLKRGGETVYFGPTGEMSVDVLNYFEGHGLVCDPLKNPADFILDVTDEVIDTTLNGEPYQFHPVQKFKESSLNTNLLAKINEGVMPSGTPVPEFHGIYSSTYGTQFKELMVRAWLAQTRRVQNIRTRLMRSLFLGVILGTLFVRMSTNQENIYNRVSILFFSLMFGGMSGMSSIPVVNMERGVFYREQSSGMYSIPIYLVTFVTADLPWNFLSAIIYAIPCYFISGLRTDPNGAPFFYFCFVLFTTYLNFALLAIVFACVLPTDEIAHALGGVALSISSLFAGFMIPPGSIAKGWHWFYDLDPTTYPLAIVMVNEFRDLEFHCDNDEYVQVPYNYTRLNELGDYSQGNATECYNTVAYPNAECKTRAYCQVTNGNLILDRYEMKEENMYKFLSVIFGYAVFFLICLFIALRFIRHQTK
ncbi:ABC transporter G family protein [Dictyostelium purpureum]|uniref:ABC transporter G family protein n=1 Tax=Dictyostelium purpureum TaxID=5786 RepID=F0ZUX5_DICPU|nr:ABC transporter G family protein [Dictyostelium purpureum]EGC32249.1 ABC transporter G family protein [Dictyostelium purpureum]|eukprot:XP_003291216.1 ABC transporter G family protein [Dictyostelium purpureum]